MGVPRGRIMRRTQRTGDAVKITSADGRETTAHKGGIYNWGGDSKGGLMGGIGKSYHFHLMLTACCRNSNGGKGLGVNTKDADAGNDTL
jgi:hypothetical protein